MQLYTFRIAEWLYGVVIPLIVPLMRLLAWFSTLIECFSSALCMIGARTAAAPESPTLLPRNLKNHQLQSAARY